MEVVAHLRKVRLSPQKTRLVIDTVRGLPVDKASQKLKIGSTSIKKAAPIVLKLLESAISNAEHNHNLDIDQLKISTIYVNQGTPYKRMQANAKGKGSRIVKPTSHITIKLTDSRGLK